VLTSNGTTWTSSSVPTILPVVDTTSIVKGSIDATKLLRFDVAGNTTGITGVLASAFTTAKTLTLPDATDTLVGRSTTDILTNKTLTGGTTTTSDKNYNQVNAHRR
jgi:hypothetical protein